MLLYLTWLYAITELDYWTLPKIEHLLLNWAYWCYMKKTGNAICIILYTMVMSCIKDAARYIFTHAYTRAHICMWVYIHHIHLTKSIHILVHYYRRVPFFEGG